MRGKALRPHTSRMLHRITPAYAGKSHAPVMQHPVKRDHPRVCGEKSRPGSLFSRLPGSPPRMRGKVLSQLLKSGKSGITPAYAGKRVNKFHDYFSSRDHPRVCGEKVKPYVISFQVRGSPPRMRGKVFYYPRQGGQEGITPAYAGKSGSSRF